MSGKVTPPVHRQQAVDFLPPPHGPLQPVWKMCLHTHTSPRSHQSRRHAHASREITHQNHDPACENQPHAHTRHDPLHEEKLPPPGTEARDDQTRHEHDSTAGKTETEMATIDERAGDDAHEEDEEDLEGANPSNLRRGVRSEDGGFVIGLEKAVRLELSVKALDAMWIKIHHV